MNELITLNGCNISALSACIVSIFRLVVRVYSFSCILCNVFYINRLVLIGRRLIPRAQPSSKQEILMNSCYSQRHYKFSC
jgi:hypothetical protein